MWEPVINEPRREENKKEIQKTLSQIADQAFQEGSPTHFVIQAQNFDMYSFPYDDPRNTLRRPDLVDLIDLVEPHFDLRILLTTRNQVDSIVSLIRRKWWNKEMCERIPVPSQKEILYTNWTLSPCGYINTQARVVEDSLTYLASHLSLLSLGYFRSVSYEELLSDPASYVEGLAGFLSFDEKVVDSSI